MDWKRLQASLIAAAMATAMVLSSTLVTFSGSWA
jgi:hypothetical protein